MEASHLNGMIYNTLAHYYDALVKDDQATSAWHDWIHTVKIGFSILELACGSGEITRHLAQDGVHIDALDLSEEMIAEAKQKQDSQSIHYFTGNMLDLKECGQYEAILCLCDSINYILDPDDLIHLFREVDAHLSDSGYFLFDTHSLDRLEEFQEEFNETGEFEDGVQYQWSIMAEDDFIYQDFAFYKLDGTIQQEHHIQRVYEPTWLHEQLERFFTIVDIRTDFDQEGIQSGEKYFYIVQKKGKEQ